MDRKKAINRLENLKAHCVEMKKEGGAIWGEDVEALEYALKNIKAWQQVITEIKNFENEICYFSPVEIKDEETVQKVFSEVNKIIARQFYRSNK